jgi:hypothetical protein
LLRSAGPGQTTGTEARRLRDVEAELVALRRELRAALGRIHDLEKENVALKEKNHKLTEENQGLRNEVARLKKQKGKPFIGPSKLDHPEEKKKRAGRSAGKLRQKRQPDRTVFVRAVDVPAGSVFKGYADFTVQELVIRSEVVRYRAEKWLTPEGRTISGKLPKEAADGHFGSVLRCFVLYQYYHAQVTEPLLLEALHEWGIVISSGQLHNLITENKELFHREKDDILRMGLQVSRHIHVDDTGARHKGKNGYCTHIGNEWFAWFESTESKSRINFLKLLRAGSTNYVLCGEALEYMAAQDLPKQTLHKLAGYGEQTIEGDHAWQAFIGHCKITNEREVRIVTEGALLGAILSRGIHPELVIVSDDAGQFNVLLHALCWIHAERILAKLVGFHEDQREALEQIRNEVWQLYRELKAYKNTPTPAHKAVLEAQFDDLCRTKTCFMSLNLALQRMGRNKRELLLVLDRPDLPLHNNLSEGDIREYVKRRKLSGGTRSESGRRGRDTFASLKKTCRKLGISFWAYLSDRLLGENLIHPLPKLIEARAQPP